MRFSRCAAGAIVWGCLLAGASAFNLNVGFESPDYNVGSTLTGSNGWEPIDGGAAVGEIESSVAKLGSQAVKFQRTGSESATWGAYVTHTGLVPTAEEPIVRIEWDMYALDGSSRSDIWGVSSYFGSERMTVGISATNKLTVRNAAIGTVVTNYALARDAWFHYRMDLDYNNLKSKVYVDDNYIGEWAILNGTVEHKGTALFNRSFGGNDGAIFDNLSISSAQAVPEPATLSVAAIGVLALIRRRRARH